MNQCDIEKQMIEQRATVTRAEADFAWVEAQRETSCGTCSVQKGCGTGLLAKSIGRRFIRMRVLNPVGARAGDEVIIGLPEDAFLKSAFLTYLLPLLLMLLAAVIASELSTNQLVVAAGGIGGFLLGWGILRHHARRLAKDPAHQPVVLRTTHPNIRTDHGTQTIVHTSF